MINLAGQYRPETDTTIVGELTIAGIQPLKVGMSDMEVKTHYVGLLEGTGWSFRRAWYYWVAEWKPPSKPITMEQAKRLFATHGKDVRTDGHCGCPAPDEWWGKDGIPHCYHVDSQEGLNALVQIILENNQ